MADSHKKIEAKEAVAKEKDEHSAYSPESLRANMSTGGGTPIPRGHKWTNERRVLQPRDPDTGHFTYNADAELSLKYKSHGKKNADPVAMKGMRLNSDIKKGDVVNIGDETFIALKDISYKKMKDFFRRYSEEYGEHYSYGQLPSSATMADKFTEIAGNVKAVKLSDLLVKKKGRMSASEKQGISQDKDVVGKVDISKLGNKTKQEIADKIASAKKKFSPNGKVTQFVAPISAQKLQSNMASNARQQQIAQARATAQAPQAQMGIGGQPQPAQPAQPSRAQAQPSSPSVKARLDAGNTIGFKKNKSPSKEDIAAAIAKYRK